MARLHEAVAWLRRAARPCWAACFLIELRCALWASPPSITAFVLPALLCQPVCAALVRPAQVPGSYTACASPVLVSALMRRYGLGSLTHRGWHSSSTVVDVRTLRQNYITPYCIKCRSSHSQAHFVALHRWRALRVYAAGVMQNCLRWSGHQPPALPGRFAPYVQSSVALAVFWRCGICQALCALFWFVAYGQASCVCPCPPWAGLLRKHRPRGLPVCPPRGLPQNRAKPHRRSCPCCHQ